MATRRQCLKRKKKRRLSERSEFPTLPVSGAGGACTPRSGAPSSGSPFLAYFFWRSKRSRSAAGTNSRLVPDDSAISTFHQSSARCTVALFERVKLQRQLLLRSDVRCQVNKAEVLPDDQAGSPSRRPGNLFCFAISSHP